MRRSGFVMILALVFMLVLATMVLAMAYFVASETRGIGFQLDDTKALYLAQAGVERVLRNIRDGAPVPTLPATLGDGTIEYVSVTFPAPDVLRIEVLGKIPLGTSPSAGEVTAHVIATFTGVDFVECSSWRETYES